MERRCGWCQSVTYIEAAESPRARAIASHGICDACLRKMRAAIGLEIEPSIGASNSYRAKGCVDSDEVTS